MLFSEVFQRRLLSVCIIVSFGVMCLTAVLMGAEYDEAWIVASSRQAFDAEAIPSVVPVTTTGGLHFLVVGTTQWLPVSPLVVPRLISLLSIAVLYMMVLRTLRSVITSPVEQKILAAACIAAPGTVLLSGMGYAVVLATTLFLSGLLIALRDNSISVKTALTAGVLIGCALATRWTLLPALPAVLLCAVLYRNHFWRNLLMCLLTSGIAVMVFAGLLILQTRLLAGTGPSGDVSIIANLGSAGVGHGLPSPARMYSYVVRFVTMLPMTLVFLALAAGLVWRNDTRIGRLVLVLLAASLLITGAWTVSSPWMHLRYIWPVYLMVALCAGLCLIALLRLTKTLQREDLSLAVVCFTALLACTQIVVAIRVIAIGAAMQINAAGYENLENHFKPFHHIQEQHEIVRHLKSLPPDTVVGMIGMPAEFGALELALLSGRRVFDFAIARDLHGDTQPDYIVTHRFSPFNNAGRQWLGTLGAPVSEIKGYSLYAFHDGANLPTPEDILLDHQLYRFSLERWVSLSWY